MPDSQCYEIPTTSSLEKSKYIVGMFKLALKQHNFL